MSLCCSTSQKRVFNDLHQQGCWRIEQNILSLILSYWLHSVIRLSSMFLTLNFEFIWILKMTLVKNYFIHNECVFLLPFRKILCPVVNTVASGILFCFSISIQWIFTFFWLQSSCKFLLGDPPVWVIWLLWCGCPF